MKIAMSCFVLILCVMVSMLPNFLLHQTLPVEYVTPKTESIKEYIYCTGTIQAEKYAEIYMDTPIYSEKVHFKVGDFVEDGDLLISVDAETTMNILTSSTPVEASIQRISSLIAALPDPEILYTVGKAYGITPQQVEELYASAQYAQVEDVGTLYIPQEITAPFSGIITDMKVKENILTRANQPVVTLCDPSTLHAIVQVNQNDVQNLQNGMEAVLYDGDSEVLGSVTHIAPTAKTTGGSPTVEVTIALHETQNLKVGYTVNAKILVKESENVLTIPIEAIHQDERNQEFVYTVVGGQPIKKEVTVGTETPYSSEILTGIQEDEMIIISYDEIRKGKRIYIKGEKEANGEETEN